ncbi:MAG: hypothetical protein ABW208_25110 [Pyrinomonadaceae bacterium]
MYLFLLKKALPFTLTFIFGAALSALTGLFGASEQKAESVLGTRTYDYGSRCRMRRRHLVAETKSLTILFKPDARYPLAPESRVRVNVTFGADGSVKEVRPLASLSHGGDESLVEVKAMWEAVERAARGIRFTPETVNGMPVTVEREVEMRFLPE